MRISEAFTTSPKKKAWFSSRAIYMPLIMGLCYGVIVLHLSLPDTVQSFWQFAIAALLFGIGVVEKMWMSDIYLSLKRRHG